MWGKILIGLAFLSLLHCHGGAITCDPASTNPGCPMGPNGQPRICDPTGICQIQCAGSSDACTDPQTTCDISSNLISLCQTDCSLTGTSGICPSGQLCFPYNPPAPSGSSPGQITTQKTCKAYCSNSNPNACGANPQFQCNIVANSSQSYCWGKQNSQ